MGFYYGPSQDPKEPEQPGCMDALILTRVILGLLLWPLVVLVGLVAVVVALVYLFSTFWLLGVLGLLVIAGGIYLYSRWERRRFQGPDLD